MTPLRTWLVVAAAWIAYTIPEALQFSAEGVRIDPRETFVVCLMVLLPRALFLWTPLTVVLLAVARRFPLTPGLWRKRIPQLVGVILAALVFRTMAERVLYQIDHYLVPDLYEAPGPFFEQFIQRVFAYHQKVLLVVCFCYAWTHVQAERENRERIAELEMRVARARLDAVAAQLNPDFLFDTLRNIAKLAHTDADTADRMLMTFSSLLRFSLDHRDDTIEVEEEVGLARQFFAIENIRLGGRLDVQWAIDPGTAGARIPALVVQSLAERLVRREDMPGPVALRIALHRDGDAVVLDMTRAQPASMPRDGLDLAEVRTRLDRLYGARATLVAGDEGVRLTLPEG